jgi:hypothetical protein
MLLVVRKREQINNISQFCEVEDRGFELVEGAENLC